MTVEKLVKRMIESALRDLKITSASPEHVNTVTEVTGIDSVPIDKEIQNLISKSPAATTSEKNQDDINDTVKSFKDGNVGKLESMSSQQFGNVQSMARDPFGFLFSGFLKKFAKGAGVVALATLIFEAVKFIIDELFKPGRDLDRTFKRKIRDEILLFNNEREQAELRQGFRSVIVTSISGLRGSEIRGQISGNLYNPTAIPVNRIEPRRIETQNVRTFTQQTRGQSRFGR